MSSSKVKFKKTKFHETGEQLVNPERGFYQIHTFVLGEEISMKDREYTLNGTDTLALVLIDISAYRNRDLDDLAIESLHKIFSFFREYGIDMILRVVYDTVGRCMETEPEQEEQVLSHMRQLGPVLKEYKTEIFVYQGLLIGNWGEMHSSKFLSPSRLIRLSEVLRKELVDTTFIAVRRPAYVRILFPEGEDLRQKEVGIFDDAILASPTHLGTFGTMGAKEARRDQSWTPKEEMSYVRTLCDHAPYGGEALWSDEKDGLEKIRRSLKSTMNYLSSLHLTYLNRVHDERMMEQLRKEKWTAVDVYRGLNGYEYLERHMGYRLLFEEVNCQKDPDGTDTLQWEFYIQNVGFSRLFFDCEIELIGTDASGREKIISISDQMELADVSSGEIHRFHISTEVLYGDIYFYARKKSTKRGVHFANKTDNPKDARVYIGSIKG